MARVRRDGAGRMLTAASADMPVTEPPPGLEEIQRQELSKLFGRMVRGRVAVLPVGLALLVWVAVGDGAAWRRALLLGMASAVSALFILELIRFRRRGLTRSSIPLNLTLATFGPIAIMLGTGGLDSPFIYVLVPMATLVGLFAPRRLAFALAGSQVAAIWVFAALALSEAVPDLVLASFGGGARVNHSDARTWTVAVMLTVVVIMVASAGRVLRAAFDAMAAHALAAQAESLRAHAERAEELAALSGEIAHELKNPLASVKGLGGLLAQGIAPGKPAERLAVLRREVDRMQGILDEFLNFSRPLVPLALGRVDLGALCHEVAALHEGMAQERGVRLEVRAAGAAARCDPRKVKQVLLNLVQNALDASRDGGAVEIEAGALPDGGGRVRVLDRGEGLEPGVAGRVFEAGVTSKEHGFGLGLTIARALARQHGGDLTLSPREGGGCAAELTLPAHPAAPLPRSPGEAA